MSDREVPSPGAGAPGIDADDREAIRRLGAGDLAALDELYERHGAMAFSIALRITGDRATAEDAVQDAFLGALRNASGYRSARGSVRTWLLSIVHHRSIDAVRRRRPTAELPGDEIAVPAAMRAPDTWEAVSEHLDGEAVRSALATLPAVQREVIELAYFGGLTQAEIADRTAAPLGTVKGRMRLGLEGLRAALMTPIAIHAADRALERLPALGGSDDG